MKNYLSFYVLCFVGSLVLCVLTIFISTTSAVDIPYPGLLVGIDDVVIALSKLTTNEILMVIAVLISSTLALGINLVPDEKEDGALMLAIFAVMFIALLTAVIRYFSVYASFIVISGIAQLHIVMEVGYMVYLTFIRAKN